MEYVKLGRTGLEVSRLCLGTMGFGSATRTSHLDAALGALDLELTAEEIAALEAPYVPHRVIGALAPGESTLGAAAKNR